MTHRDVHLCCANRHILTPSWFQVLQALVTLEFVANGVSLVMFTLYVYRACDTRYPKRAKRWLQIVVGLLSASTLCSWIATVLFGLCFADEYWMPFHQLNYPHFSFYVHIVAGGVVFSAVLFLVRRIDVESKNAVTYEHEFKMVPGAKPQTQSTPQTMQTKSRAPNMAGSKKRLNVEPNEETFRPLVSGNL